VVDIPRSAEGEGERRWIVQYRHHEEGGETSVPGQGKCAGKSTLPPSSYFVGTGRRTG